MIRTLLLIAFVADTLDALAQHHYVPASTSSISFTIENFGVSVHGSFGALAGEVFYDPANPQQSNFNIVVPINTLTTGIALRDKHLKKEDYFDADHYANMRFVSDTALLDGSSGTIKGLLTIKNITLPIVIKCKVASTVEAVLWEGDFELDRRDYTVGGNSISMSDVVKVKVKLVCSQREGQ